jgi:prevent-host-death family protein
VNLRPLCSTHSFETISAILTSYMTSQQGAFFMVWPVQDAKARFSELLDASLRDGPQVVTRRGVEAAVLVPIEEWRRLTQAARPTLKELLLSAESRFAITVPQRGRLRRRPATEFA